MAGWLGETEPLQSLVLDRDAVRSRPCPPSASPRGTNPHRSPPSTFSPSSCPGSSVDSTPVGFALLYFHVTAINFALVWPLKVTACRRHLFRTTTGIRCPRAPASLLQLPVLRARRQHVRCPFCGVFHLLQPKPGPFYSRHRTATPYKTGVLYKTGIYTIPAPLWAQRAPSGAQREPALCRRVLFSGWEQHS